MVTANGVEMHFRYVNRTSWMVQPNGDHYVKFCCAPGSLELKMDQREMARMVLMQRISDTETAVERLKKELVKLPRGSDGSDS